MALTWPAGQPAASGAAAALAMEMDRLGDWREIGRTDHLILWTWTAAPFPVIALPDSSGFLIGEVFAMPGHAAPVSTVRHAEAVTPRPKAMARQLASSCWGQFVALLHGSSPDETAIYRDPSGMVDAVTWSLGGGLDVIASDMTRAPTALQPRWPYLNWDRIVSFLAVPTAATTESLFEGVHAVGPGELLAVGRPSDEGQTIWSPVAFAKADAPDHEALAERFVDLTDRCTQALVGAHARVLMELSGGLDSSALAASLAQTGLTSRVAQWINIADLRPEADERRYAQAVADRIGVDLTIVQREAAALTEEDVRDLGSQFWPAIAGVDAMRDRDEVARIAATGSTAIVSGQGGDGVFFQMGSPLVVADALGRDGLAALGQPIMAEVARRLRRSVWSVLWEACAAARHRASGPKIVNRLLSRSALALGGDAEHAWVRALDETDLPPGKRFHIRALATNHFNHACSRRRQVADLLYPLLAQPIVELALRVPTPDLAGGNHGRPLQRKIFAERLPALVLQRRAKGNVSVYVAQMMARSLDFLRPYLLDGCLCDAGVLDRRKLEQVLDPRYLIQTAAGNDLVGAIAVEAWVRYWQTRAPDAGAASRHRF